MQMKKGLFRMNDVYTCINAKHVSKNVLVGYLHSALELSFVRDVQR